MQTFVSEVLNILHNLGFNIYKEYENKEVFSVKAKLYSCILCCSLYLDYSKSVNRCDVELNWYDFYGEVLTRDAILGHELLPSFWNEFSQERIKEEIEKLTQGAKKELNGWKKVIINNSSAILERVVLYENCSLKPHQHAFKGYRLQLKGLNRMETISLLSNLFLLLDLLYTLVKE